MKIPFSQLSKELQLIYTTIPVYLPSTQNPDAETKQQVVERQERFLKLPKNIRWKLASFETGDKIESLGRKYGFELLRLANITRLVREYYFGEVRLDDFPREIEKRINVSLLTAQEIARFIKTEIIDWNPYAEFLATLPKLPIREALKKYPAVGEQEISSGYLEIRGRDDIFDGTIHNWINDYILHLGQERHGTIDRTNYLFHSENTKNLASPEREKLGIILKSFDENAPLPVDVENNEVILETSDQRSMIKDQQRPAASVAKTTSQPQRPTKENFIKPYPKPEANFQIKSQPAPKKIPAIKYPPASRPGREAPRSGRVRDADQMHFTSPYPKPGTHEMPREEEIIKGGTSSPLVVKDYVPRQNISGAEPAPRQFIRHPKNIIEPISSPRFASDEAGRPEPRIEGNIVDLSEKK